MITRPNPARVPLALALALGAAVALAACSTGTSEDTSSTAPQDSAPAEQARGGVMGEIAAVSDGLLQVQDADSQTAVSYTGDTGIRSQVAGSLDDVAVGACIVAMGAGDDGAGATSVIVTEAVDGACTAGFGGGALGGGAGSDGGGMPTGRPMDGEAPEGMPSGAPESGAGGPGGTGFGAITAGLVTAVSGSTITVEQTSADDATGSAEVTVDEATAYTITVDADETALVVGACVSAQGEADDAGGFAATSLTVSAAGDEGCTAGIAVSGPRPAGGATGTGGE